MLTAELGRQLKHITKSTLRPNVILVSEATRKLILPELMVLWEERMEEAQENCQGLDCGRNLRRTRCVPVEVG